MPSEPFAPIETDRLHLRCVALGDAAATAALMTEGVSRWLASWPVPFTAEMARRRIEAVRERACRKDMAPFAIILKETGALAGWMSLERCTAAPRRGALGYWLGEAFHGQGLAQEALVAVLRAGFGLLDLDVIEAGAQPENAKSLAMMRACGMSAAGKRMVYAASRCRRELCQFYEIGRDALV